MEINGIELHHFHGFDFFDARFFGNAVFTHILVIFEMSGIGDVANITDFVPQMFEVAVDQIKGNKSPAIAQMDVAVNCGATDIHSYIARVKGLKRFFFSA